MKVSKTPLPRASHLWSMVKEGDFMDGYAVTSDLTPEAAAEVGLSLPRWAKALLGLRNLLVRPFGLKTEVRSDQNDPIFPITYESTEEIILGTDDKHLNFRIALRQEGGVIHMATWVHRHNIFGDFYLALVMPFHILIVRNAMRRIGKHSQA